MRKPTMIFKYRIIDGHVEFSYCMLLTNLIINPSSAVLTVLLGPWKNSAPGPIPTPWQALTGIKLQMSIELNINLLYSKSLNQCTLKSMLYTTYIDSHGAPYYRGTPGQLPTALNPSNLKLQSRDKYHQFLD